MLRRSLTFATAALAVALAVACTGDSEEPSTPASTEPATSVVTPITQQALENATITTDLVPEGQVNLQGGTHSQPAAPGSAATVDFELSSTVVDDLDGDGFDDGAMIVRSSGSGSGTFYDLYVFLAAESGLQQVAKEQLGDRIVVEGIAAGPGGVTVFYLDRPADAPRTRRREGRGHSGRPRPGVARAAEPHPRDGDRHAPGDVDHVAGRRRLRRSRPGGGGRLVRLRREHAVG